MKLLRAFQAYLNERIYLPSSSREIVQRPNRGFHVLYHTILGTAYFGGGMTFVGDGSAKQTAHGKLNVQIEQ